MAEKPRRKTLSTSRKPRKSKKVSDAESPGPAMKDYQQHVARISKPKRNTLSRPRPKRPSDSHKDSAHPEDAKKPKKIKKLSNAPENRPRIATKIDYEHYVTRIRKEHRDTLSKPRNPRISHPKDVNPPKDTPDTAFVPTKKQHTQDVVTNSILTHQKNKNAAAIKDAETHVIKSTDTKFLLQPKLIDTETSFQDPHTRINTNRAYRSTLAKPKSNQNHNQSTINTFLKTFGFRQLKVESKKHFEVITYDIHVINVPPVVKLLAFIAPFWEWCMYVMGLASFFIITILSVFSFYVETLYDIVYWVDVIFGIDTVMRVLVEIWRYHSGTPCIIFITPYTTTQFIVDMCSIIPLERIYALYVGIKSVEYLKYFDFFRYNRFFRLKRLFSFLTAALREQRITDKVQFFVWYFTCIVMFIQLISCIFYISLVPDPIDFILKRKRENLTGSWIGTLNDDKPGFTDSSVSRYILAFSFSTAVVTTVGYGDVSPTTEVEMLVGILAMLCGAIFLTGLFSSGLTSFELEHDGARFDLFFRVDALMLHLIEINTTPFYRKKVLEYYNLLWNYREGVFNVQLFDQLPKTMQEEIWFDICQEMFHKSALFRGLEESFLRALARIAKPVLYNENMILCTDGKYAMQMMYIIQGEVLVRSKYKSNKAAAILRPGCIFGEINLFFSYPYAANVETKTCCQLLIFDKESLFDLLSLHKIPLEILRQRVQERLAHLHRFYRVVGEVPLYWIEFGLGYSDEDPNHPRNVSPVLFRKGTGWNYQISHDILDDSRDLIIVEMPCINKRFEKGHTTVYKSAVVPNILVSKNRWIRIWHISVMLLAMYGAFLGPYCLVFKATSQIENLICQIDAEVFEWFVAVIFIADIFIEILTAVPCTGLYYKFWDGISIKKTELWFWVDVLSAIPLNLAGSQLQIRPDEVERVISIIGTSLRCLKLWKVLRFFNYLDNTYYNRLFTFRLIQTLVVLVYFTHFLACIIFMIACPSSSRTQAPKCEPNTWLRSYEVKDKENADYKYNKLSQDMPYLLSFYFASATLSSAGFGDFNPQNPEEIIFILIFELISFTIIGYYTAILTSALSCTIRPQLVFQQKLLGIKQFMEHQGVSEDLQHRVVEHYYLQNLLWAGVTLPDKMYHFMYDTPDYLRDDSLILEVDLHFEGVPLLTKVEPKIIVKIAELVRRYLIPPNSVFLRKGEVRRQMYIIGKGAVGILSDKTQLPERILETTSHFGIRDLLFGEPAHNHIKTLSYCLLYEVEFHDLDELFSKEPQLVKLLDRERSIYQEDIDEMTKVYARFKTTIKEKPKTTESWVLFPWFPTQNPKLFCCPYAEYIEVFQKLRFKWLYSILLHKTIHPGGLFAKIWICNMSFVSSITLVFLLFESYAGKRDPQFRGLQYGCDLVNYLDIFLKLHWGFYNKKNILISHPARTALHYIYEGGFFFDVFFAAPFEFIMPLATDTNIWGYSRGVYWISKLRWTRFPQVFRIPAVVSVCNNIFTNRNETLVLLYFGLTIILCTLTSCIALYIACPIGAKIWDDGDEYKLPFCLRDSWASKKDGVVLVDMGQRLIYGIYYTSNVIFAIGFGDLITLRRAELVLLIIMMVFGFIVDVCILANITAAEVDIDENRARYLQQMECIEYVLYKEQVNTTLRKIIREHLQHTWLMSKGLQPNTLFVDLHPALESDLFREYVGELLKKVPIFSGLPENIVRTLCQYMKKHYFLKGEALMKAGNLEPEMYVVVSGKVWVTDKDNDWICTLRSGETFGETSMLFGSPRRYSAYAGSAAETFCLTNFDFEEVLERYPSVKRDLTKKVPSGSEDLFERKVKKAAGLLGTTSNLTTTTLNKKHSRAKKINAYIKTKLLIDPGEFGTTSNAQTQLRLFGSGIDDENLPFLYFAKKNTNGKFKLLIHPECFFMKYIISYIVVTMSFFTPMMATYEMSFVSADHCNPREETCAHFLDKSIVLLVLHVIGETPMYLNILLQFITPFRVGESLEFCKEHKKIALNYVMSPVRFFFDFISIFPLPLAFVSMYEFFGTNPIESPNLKRLYLLRIFRLYHFYKSLVEKKDDLGTGIFFYKVFVSLSSFLLIIHAVSCFVYEIAPCYCGGTNATCTFFEETCQAGTWTHAFLDKHGYTLRSQMQPYKWYVRSFYWVTSTVSTTGFGDIVPLTIPEIIMATLCTFVGAFILAIILSQFTSGISSRSKSHREFLYQVNLLGKHLGNIGTSHDRRDRVRAYFVTLWERSKGVPYHEAVKILPLTMQIEINFFLYYEAVKNCTLFYRINDKIFLRQVCIRLKHTLLLPGSVIVNQGDQSGNLYIVFKGVVTGYRDQEDGVPVATRQYHRGGCFGKFPALFFDEAYNKSYRTETFTEVLSLAQEDLMELVKYFPDFAESLQFVIIRKYDPNYERDPKEDPIENIFQKRKKRKGLFSLESGLNAGGDSGPGLFGESKRLIEIALENKNKEKLEEANVLNEHGSSSSSSSSETLKHTKQPPTAAAAKVKRGRSKKKAVKSKVKAGKKPSSRSKSGKRKSKKKVAS